MKRSRIVTSRAVCGVLGKGSNVTEAKEDARKRIERAFSEDENYQPEVIAHAGHIAVMFRTLDGWAYHFIKHPREELRLGKIWGASGQQMAYDECKRQMSRHIADIGFTPGDEVTEPPAFVTNEHDRAELVKGWHWQNGIVEGRKLGLGDEEARLYADFKTGRGLAGWGMPQETIERVRALAADDDEDNPLVICPGCGQMAREMEGYSYLAAGMNGIRHGDAEDLNVLECGKCEAKFDPDTRALVAVGQQGVAA